MVESTGMCDGSYVVNIVIFIDIWSNFYLIVCNHLCSWEHLLLYFTAAPFSLIALTSSLGFSALQWTESWLTTDSLTNCTNWTLTLTTWLTGLLTTDSLCHYSCALRWTGLGSLKIFTATSYRFITLREVFSNFWRILDHQRQFSRFSDNPDITRGVHRPDDMIRLPQGCLSLVAPRYSTNLSRCCWIL
jgi:hypothetical protein